MANPHDEQEREARRRAAEEREEEIASSSSPDDDEVANPPRTKEGGITAPKFGSAGSGGAELEPGPPRP